MIGKLEQILKYHRDRNLPLVWHPTARENIHFKRCYGSWQFNESEYEWCISQKGVEMWPVKETPQSVKTYRVT